MTPARLRWVAWTVALWGAACGVDQRALSSADELEGGIDAKANASMGDAGLNDGPRDGSAGCMPGTKRPCQNVSGNCANGHQACGSDGVYGACDVMPKPSDACDVPGDDANCNGTPNGGCPCIDGATQPCGAAAPQGICRGGTSTCENQRWGSCIGEVQPSPRNCESSQDNDCDGMPDNTVDGVCKCVPATKQPCQTHPGADGKGPCRAGEQTCIASDNKSASDWAVCAGSVGPLAADLCTTKGDDSNCNGTPNDACPCVDGDTQACGPTRPTGICTSGTAHCRNKIWADCDATFPKTRDCTSSADNDCDGKPDNTIDGVCQCNSAGAAACDTHPQDGVGICKAGSRTCTINADKSTGSWSACSGSVGQRARDCTSTADNDCDGSPDTCSGSMPVCLNASCVACTPGDGTPTQCGPNNTPQFCNSSGQWQNATACTGSTPNCVAGQCKCTATVCSTACADLATDPHHCGACGHDCLGGTCQSNLCQPVTLATAQNGPRRIAVDSTNVYWINQAGGSIMRVPVGGGVPQTLASGQNNPFGLAVDSTSVYWTNPGVPGTVMRVPVGGGAPQTLASGQNNPGGIAVDATNVYWTNLADGTIMSVPRTGGTPTPVASAQSTPFGIAVDSTSVYWTNINGGHEVQRVLLGGGTLTTLASGQSGPSGIAVDATTVYWSNEVANGTIMSVPRGGGAIATLASGLGQPNVVAVDATNVYWAASGGVMRVARSGGMAQTVAFGIAYAIAMDAISVYYTNNDSVLRVAK